MNSWKFFLVCRNKESLDIAGKVNLAINEFLGLSLSSVLFWIWFTSLTSFFHFLPSHTLSLIAGPSDLGNKNVYDNDVEAMMESCFWRKSNFSVTFWEWKTFWNTPVELSLDSQQKLTKNPLHSLKHNLEERKKLERKNEACLARNTFVAFVLTRVTRQSFSWLCGFFLICSSQFCVSAAPKQRLFSQK